MNVRELIKKLEVIDDKEAEIKVCCDDIEVQDNYAQHAPTIDIVQDNSETTKEVILWHD